ncbi:uncharacterized protein BXZ73DRAFT_73369 [Epithele typhae]|uniref:uncharacterized protein n=1 Tax=Epithele typhae TaxID=378194 RepID=UPI0020088858|nr:uncharacterized protein BXZ73DRAFT_73369 [Epithele typhae]KAH9945182.1 hypothetical protein BXZ73DRAFT_73369 [Epithele typhae]
MDTLKGKEKASDDVFFMERLEMLYEQGLSDLRAFAERESRPFDEVKRRMAEVHCRSLFGGAGSQNLSDDRRQIVSQALQTISQQLESLEALVGLQSFFLAVRPSDPDDAGFLGGTNIGREFWRGHRGCGAPGAELFKTQCARAQNLNMSSVLTAVAPLPTVSVHPATNPTRKKQPAHEVKTQLYGAFRDKLRKLSGVRNAEMKWTNHTKLDVYQVQIHGWPENVPLQNPSMLSLAHNKHLLELITAGKIHFTRIGGHPSGDTSSTMDYEIQKDEDTIFEDSIDYSWAADDPHTKITVMTICTTPLHLDV